MRGRGSCRRRRRWCRRPCYGGRAGGSRCAGAALRGSSGGWTRGRTRRCRASFRVVAAASAGGQQTGQRNQGGRERGPGSSTPSTVLRHHDHSFAPPDVTATSSSAVRFPQHPTSSGGPQRMPESKGMTMVSRALGGRSGQGLPSRTTGQPSSQPGTSPRCAPADTGTHLGVASRKISAGMATAPIQRIGVVPRRALRRGLWRRCCRR